MENINSILSFIEGGKIVEILEKVGDIHYKAAITAFRDRSHSSVPKREIESAITSLRPAYEAFWEAASKTSFFGWLCEPVEKRIENYTKACETALLIAICYKALREQSLTESYLNKAKTCFNKYIESVIDYVLHEQTSPTNAEYGLLTVNPKNIQKGIDAETKAFNSFIERLKAA
jgi:hypothetical protein